MYIEESYLCVVLRYKKREAKNVEWDVKLQQNSINESVGYYRILAILCIILKVSWLVLKYSHTKNYLKCINKHYSIEHSANTFKEKYLIYILYDVIVKRDGTQVSKFKWPHFIIFFCNALK